MLYDDAPYVVTVLLRRTSRPTAPTGSPASSRSRTRTARCSSSTAPTATSYIAPVTAATARRRSSSQRPGCGSAWRRRAALVGAGGLGRGFLRDAVARASGRPGVAPMAAPSTLAAASGADGTEAGRPASGRRPACATSVPQDAGRRWRSLALRRWSSTSSCSGCCPATRPRRCTPRPQRAAGAGRASYGAARARQAAAAAVPRLHQEPVLHGDLGISYQFSQPVWRRHRRPDLADAAAGRHLDDAVDGHRRRGSGSGRLAARQRVRPDVAPASR